MPKISLVNRHRTKRPDLKRLRILARQISTGLNFRRLEVHFLLTTNREIRKIHGRFMRDPTATDVITFADRTPSPLVALPAGRQEEGGGEGTIDVVISLDRAEKQAKNRGLKLFYEVALLMCHGLLHAKGYDDRTEKDRLIMRRKEFEWMMRVLSRHVG